MKKQFIKFLEDNRCLNDWMNAICMSGKNPTTFVAVEPVYSWITGAFSWIDHQSVDWYKIHKLWSEYIDKQKL